MKLPAQGREKNRYLKQPYYIQSEILNSLPKERIPLFHHILAECVEEIGDNESRLIIKDDDAADGFEVFLDFLYAKNEQAERTLLNSARSRNRLQRFAQYFGATLLQEHLAGFAVPKSTKTASEERDNPPMKKRDDKSISRSPTGRLESIHDKVSGEECSRASRNYSQSTRSPIDWLESIHDKISGGEFSRASDNYSPSTRSPTDMLKSIRDKVSGEQCSRASHKCSQSTRSPIDWLERIHKKVSGEESSRVSHNYSRTSARGLPSMASRSSSQSAKSASNVPPVVASDESRTLSTILTTKEEQRRRKLSQIAEILPTIVQVDSSRLEPENLLTILKERWKTNHQPNNADSEIISCVIALCIEKHKEKMTQAIFYQLTSKEFIPHIDQEAAIPILTFEEELGYWKDRDAFSSVQTRCASSLLSDFEGFRKSFVSDKDCWEALRGIAPSVLALILMHARMGSASDDSTISDVSGD
jgi:hypothetical protein